MLSFFRNFNTGRIASRLNSQVIGASRVCYVGKCEHKMINRDWSRYFSNDSSYRDPNSVSGSEAFKTITTKPSTPEELEEYARLQAKDEAETNRRRLIQDIDDEGVFVDEEPKFKNIEVVMNADGSFTFKSTETGDQASTAPPTHQQEGDENVVAVGEEHVKIDDPRLIISLTCDECNTRLTKSMPKRSYEKGVVLMRCDCCKANHLIADNLGWFANGGINVEMLMREKGQKVVRSNIDDSIDDATRAELERVLQETRPEDLAAPAAGVVSNNDASKPKTLN